MVNIPERRTRSLPYDFAYGRSDLESFPFEMWRRTLLRCARKATVSDLDYGPARGNLALREAICTHLRRSRAVMCDPSQVIVVNGSQQALDLIARVLIEPDDRVAVEDPSYQGTREVRARSRRTRRLYRNILSRGIFGSPHWLSDPTQRPALSIHSCEMAV